jgi:type II secretory pathway pseudopilin PulG
MKNSLMLAAALAASLLPQFVSAQVANEGLANAIIAARQRNAGLMKQYSWNCRTEVQENGTTKDTRIDTVTYGPDGQPQHTQLSDQSNPLPRGFVRRRIAEEEKEKMEKYIKDLRTFLHQYTMPTAGKVIDFISKTPIPPPGPDGVLRLSGSGVVIPTDTVSISVFAPTKETRRMSVMTTFQEDDVTVTATFKTLATGLNYAAYIQLNIPDKNLTILIQNYDYINQNM